MKSIFFLIFIMSCSMLVSCRQPKQSGLASASTAHVVDATASSCPHLTQNTKGNIVLSWARNLSDSESVMCFAVSADKGKSFGTPTVIPASRNVNPHAENMPKLIYKPSGEVVAAWGASNPNPKNPYAGLVYFAQSFDEGKTWGEARPLVNDPGSFDQRYFDMALLPNGEVAVIWLDNRKKNGAQGSSIYFASTSGKEGFQHETRIGESCCECCRTSLFIDSRSNIHVAYRGIINDSIRDMVHVVSSDGGKSFSPIQRLSNDNWVITGCPHTGPTMVENKNGLHFAWYTLGSGSGLYFCSSSDNGNSFTPRDSIRNKSSARHPQLTAFPNGEMLVVWDESMQRGNVPATRIGIQKRSAEGKQLFSDYITSDSLKSTYPVVQAIDENSSIIAYSQDRKEQSHVMYEVVRF